MWHLGGSRENQGDLEAESDILCLTTKLVVPRVWASPAPHFPRV